MTRTQLLITRGLHEALPPCYVPVVRDREVRLSAATLVVGMAGLVAPLWGLVVGLVLVVVERAVTVETVAPVAKPLVALQVHHPLLVPVVVAGAAERPTARLIIIGAVVLAAAE